MVQIDERNIATIGKNIDAWTSAPHMKDLSNVGKKKLVGYLPIQTIEQYGGADAMKNIKGWAKANHLSYRKFSERNCHIGSGAVYLWDTTKLFEFLHPTT